MQTTTKCTLSQYACHCKVHIITKYTLSQNVHHHKMHLVKVVRFMPGAHVTCSHIHVVNACICGDVNWKHISIKSNDVLQPTQKKRRKCANSSNSSNASSCVSYHKILVYFSKQLGVENFSLKINYKQGWACKKYRNKIGMKTQKREPCYRKIRVKEDWETAPHRLHSQATDIE